MNNEAQIEENIRTAERAHPSSLSGNEKEILINVGNQYEKLMKIPCTGCQYCLPCPAGVDIPRSFSFYNARHLFTDKLTPWGMYLMQLGKRNDRPSSMAGNCVDCGKCEKHCPQDIAIPKELKNVKKQFEGPMSHVIRFIANRMMKVDRLVED
ncbi:MAG: 4Fe-4S dicluster domain-containing protein [Spirochaetaceae bacterium]|nr:4Fe-4S dicluster domain-containing protein [Spirochaetaceae bacterium]